MKRIKTYSKENFLLLQHMKSNKNHKKIDRKSIENKNSKINYSKSKIENL